MSNTERFADLFNYLNEVKEGKVDMCKAIQELRADEWEKGMEKGENKMALLISKLINLGRNGELEKAANDTEYREKLYYELGIV